MAGDDVQIVVAAHDRASSVVNSVAGKIGGMGGALKSLAPVAAVATAAMAGAAVAVAAFNTAADKFMDSAEKIDRVTKAATGIGSSVADLQSLQLALTQIAGVETDDTVAALKEMQLRIGEMASGIGSADQLNVMKKLGLDPQSLSEMDPTAQFKAIRDAISGLQNVSDRAVVADLLFGGDGEKLLPAFIADVETFDQKLKAARQSGQALSDEQVAGVQNMNQSLDAASANFQGLIDQATASFAPAVDAIAISLNEWLPPVIQVAEVVLPAIVDATAIAAGYVIEIGKGFYALQTFDFSALNEQIRTFGSTSDEFLAKIEQARARAKEAAAEAARQREDRSQSTLAIVDKQAEDAAKQAAALEKAKAAAAERTVEQLERQLLVAQLGEDVVRRQEQLANARNEAERARIVILQQQVAAQEEANRKADEKIAAEKEAKKEAEAAAKKAADEQAKREQEQLDRLKEMAQLTGDLTATQSRTLSRGGGISWDVDRNRSNAIREEIARRQGGGQQRPMDMQIQPRPQDAREGATNRITQLVEDAGRTLKLIATRLEQEPFNETLQVELIG